MLKSVSLEKWINDNNPDAKAPYGKGFWDVVEMYQKWKHQLQASSVTVIGDIVIKTPPPVTLLKLPLVRFEFNGYQVDIAYDFSREYFAPSFLMGFCALKCLAQPSVPLAGVTTGFCGSFSTATLARELFDAFPAFKDPDGFDDYDSELAHAMSHFHIRLGIPDEVWEQTQLSKGSAGTRCVAFCQEDALMIMKSILIGKSG